MAKNSIEWNNTNKSLPPIGVVVLGASDTSGMIIIELWKRAEDSWSLFCYNNGWIEMNVSPDEWAALGFAGLTQK